MNALCAAGLVLLAVGGAAAGVPGQESTRVDGSALASMLTELDWLQRPPLVGERCVQFSSYDRRCGTDPRHADRWYANDDRGHYLRVVERDGAREHVLVDVDGPGCMARLWSANPTGALHFDVDGARVWSVDFGALCSGALAGAPAPLAAMRSRGGNVYLPVPFAKHLTVSAEAGDLYYLADVALFPDGTAVESFSPERPVAAARWQALGALDRGARVDFSYSTATAGQPAHVRSGVEVRALEVRVSAPGELTAERLGPLLDRVLLVVRCGDEQTVRVPLASFFCAASAWRPWRSHVMGIDPDRRAWCRWPMPMPEGGTVELVVEGGLGDVEVQLSGELAPLAAGPAAPLLFHADYHLVKATPTRPFSDHLVLDAKGRGRFVGCSLLVRNPSKIWWGEGDERLWVDGEAFPSWWGTGTEDYFGYAWCDPTPFEAPFHAQVVCDGPMNFGFTQLFRAQLLDHVPFQCSLRFELERWHWVEDIAVDYATVAFWYGSAGASPGLPAVPSVADRALPRLAAPRTLAVAGALEGEQLTVRSCTGGTHERQDLSIFGGAFSGDADRWWRDGAVGDRLTLVVPVADAGRYRVRAAFVCAEDFGVVRLSLAGTPLAEPFDGYSAKVTSSGPVDFGEVTLPAGELELVLELVGHNERATPRGMVGLDYLLLEKVR
ncbi:MAG: DUF2961 domain-containing protein [Planctomycetes bacterium]|nr:DUF2961 domain-containing protein [Planctomycetota bacterium]